MPRKKTQSDTQPASSGYGEQCLQYLRRCGGRARLHNLSFSLGVVQTLINQGRVRVNNSGTGFYLELSSDQ